MKPKLRFPEFNDEWVEKKLGDIAEIYDGTHQTPKYVETGIPFYSVEHVTADQFKNTKFISEQIFEKEIEKVKIEKGDILMTRIGSIGVSKYIDWDVKASFYVSLALIKSNKNYNSIYLNQYIKTSSFQKELWRRTIHVAFPQKINLGEISLCKITLSSPDEQTKIANFLTAVDRRVTLLKEKKELLKKYKKGIMQKLFSQELRFKDKNGKDFPDWEEKQLGEICKITTGKLDANAMTKNGKYRFYTCAKEYFKINSYAFDTEALLISGNGANVGYIHYYKGQFNAYQRTYILDEFTQNIFYIKYFLNKFLHKRILSEKKEGNTPYIVLSTLSEMEIKLPSSEKEQEKIANFLSSLDKKIEQVDLQIETMQEFKKGCLQQMFC